MEGRNNNLSIKEVHGSSCKFQVPNLFIYLNQTPRFERYEVTRDSKDTLKHISAQIALHSHNIVQILGPNVNIIARELHDHVMINLEQ